MPAHREHEPDPEQESYRYGDGQGWLFAGDKVFDTQGFDTSSSSFPYTSDYASPVESPNSDAHSESYASAASGPLQDFDADMPALFPPPDMIDDMPPLVDQPISPGGRKRDPSYIPRPPNAFILFRSSFIRSQHVPSAVEGNHQNLSKIAGLCWKSLSEDKKKVWEKRAREAQIEHRRRYPDWRFRPLNQKIRDGKGKRSSSRGKGKGRGGGGKGRTSPDDRRCAERNEVIASFIQEGTLGDALEDAMRAKDQETVLSQQFFGDSSSDTITAASPSSPEHARVKPEMFEPVSLTPEVDSQSEVGDDTVFKVPLTSLYKRQRAASAPVAPNVPLAGPSSMSPQSYTSSPGAYRGSTSPVASASSTEVFFRPWPLAPPRTPPHNVSAELPFHFEEDINHAMAEGASLFHSGLSDRYSSQSPTTPTFFSSHQSKPAREPPSALPYSSLRGWAGQSARENLSGLAPAPYISSLEGNVGQSPTRVIRHDNRQMSLDHTIGRPAAKRWRGEEGPKPPKLRIRNYSFNSQTGAPSMDRSMTS